jgi:cation:H+ antiporter
MILQFLLLLVGLVFLIKGADWLVAGGASLARRFHVPELTIGLTIIAFGTSAPELVVNVFASADNLPDIVFGNVIGSNLFNLFLILGIAGLITPLAVQSNTVWKEIPISLGAAIICYFLCNHLFTPGNMFLDRTDGGLLLIFFFMFLYYVYRQLGADPTESQLPEHQGMTMFKTWGFIVIGLAGLVLGGRFVVVNAVEIARTLGMSERIIGLTIVAAGTSLPELATTAVAAYRKNVDIAVGNIIGSNIFNLLLILAVSALVRPLAYNPAFNEGLLVLSGGTVFLFLAMFTGRKKTLDRWEAGLLLAAFLLYSGYLVMQDV